MVPLSELGRSEKQFHTRTHLGHLLHDGDTAWGFHFTRANLNNPNLEKMKPADIPDVVRVGQYDVMCLASVIANFVTYAAYI